MFEAGINICTVFIIIMVNEHSALNGGGVA
jgi:hypothetical protein